MAIGIVLAAIVVAIGGVAVYAVSIWDDTPSIDTLKPIDEGATSVVFAADGSRLGYIQSDTIRHPVEGDKIPNILNFATVAIEDEHFYEHSGIDYAAIARAAWADLKAGSAVQGASTITQQLVRNLYIANPQEDIKRKIHEANLAQQYEDRYTKNQILTKYLNTASYGTTNGRTAVGVQAAAETYFDKGVSKLDLPEAAMIAGLPQAPSEYNPLVNPKAALNRRNEVLLAMEQQGYISQARSTSGPHGRGPRPGPRPQVRDDPRAVLLRLRAAAADRQVRGQHGSQRRPEGVHDDQPTASGGCPAGRGLLCGLLLGRRAGRGARLG